MNKNEIIKELRKVKAIFDEPYEFSLSGDPVGTDCMYQEYRKMKAIMDFWPTFLNEFDLENLDDQELLKKEGLWEAVISMNYKYQSEIEFRKRKETPIVDTEDEPKGLFAKIKMVFGMD